MLILTRRINESIVINDNIKLTVVEIREDKVRLGVSAPKECSVHRKEVYDAIVRSNQVAEVAVPPQEPPERLSLWAKALRFCGSLLGR